VDDLLNRALIEPFGRVLLGQLLTGFYTFTLVLLRMAGLMTIGPLFGQSLVPPNVRILLVVTLSILITPALRGQSRLGFERLDADHNGRLTRDELPEQFQNRFDRLLAAAGKTTDPAAAVFLTIDEFHETAQVPSTVLNYAWIGVAEFALGLVLGLGVLTILSGLQLAGQLIDQQTGISLGQIANPGLDMNGSVTGTMLFLLGMTLLLVIKPIGGHLMMVSALVETFQTLPVGEAVVSVSSIDLLRDLVHESLVLGVQVAAPMLAVMSLMALTMGFLGHSVPQINVLVVGFPIRVLLSLGILTLAISGVGRTLVDKIPEVIDRLSIVLSGV